MFAPNTTTSGATQTGYWCYDANGQLIRDTTTCLVSAFKFKKDIKPLENGLDVVLKMRPVTYFKKEPLGMDDQGQQIGFIADWSEEVVPELVTHDSTGAVRGFNYEQYTAVLTKAIQDLNDKVEGKTIIIAAKRTVEEDWQNSILALLLIYVAYNELSKWRSRRTNQASTRIRE